MKKLRLLVAALLCAALPLGPLAACGGSSDPAADPQTIVVAAFKGAYGDAFWANIKTEFERLYAAEGYKISYEAKQNIEDTVRPQINAGQGPDVIYLPIGQEKALTEALVKSKGIEKITALLDEKIPGEDVKLRDKIMPGFLNGSSTNPYDDGDTYMLPLFYSPLGLFYNKNLFNADGTNGKYKLPVTWQDFLALKSAVNPDGNSVIDLSKGEKYLFAYPNSGYVSEMLYSLIASKAGTDALDKFFGYDVSVYDDPNFIHVFEQTAALKDYVYPSSWDSAQNYKQNQNALLQNNALFLPCGAWLPEEMADYTPAPGFEYGFTAHLDMGGGRYSHAKIEQLYILKQSKKKDVAKKFLAFMFSDAAAAIIARDAGALTPTVNALTIARQNNYFPEQKYSYFDIYSGDNAAKLSAGDFAAASVTGVVWRNTFTGNFDELMSSSDMTAAKWLKELKDDSVKLFDAKVQV
ncbi:MAG: carbohydrate ABC transporter substrate-binding protein [Clostridiales bacterium]|jgi:N-acetylglucosamine transport system substrate-binding protein|nr:carbohydrate ABC transporter substrate-binding protein [Clostridiales bacterium]